MHIKDINIHRNNVLIFIDNNTYTIKPKKIDQSCSIVLSTDYESFTTCQFSLNAKLVKQIIIEYQNKKYNINKIPFKGICINAQLSNIIFMKITINFVDLCSEFNIYNLNTYNINKFIKVQWDKIFIINLARRLDRKNIMINRLKETGLINYEFIDAIDGSDEHFIKKFNKFKQNTRTRIITSGHLGCLLSHIKALKKAKDENLNSVLILEDDVIFDKNFINKITMIKVPKYDLLYLGGLIDELKFFINGWALSKEVMGAYGYIVPAHMFSTILNEWKKLTMCSDICLINKIQSKYTTVLLNDLIKTNIDDTDTSNKHKAMNQMINNININLFDKNIIHIEKDCYNMKIIFYKKKQNIRII
jgi:GR25 family glycosyltransferase involved in LPS biosynthesis